MCSVVGYPTSLPDMILGAFLERREVGELFVVRQQLTWREVGVWKIVSQP